MKKAVREDLPEIARSGLDLAFTGIDALLFLPPLYVRSIFGHPRSWITRRAPDSEYAVIDVRHPRRSARFLFETVLPGFARSGFERIEPLNPFFWRPTTVFSYVEPDSATDAFADESWFYINGVATDRTVATMNAAVLSRMFRRPLTVIHNATNSLAVDLAECAVGKGWKIMTEPALVAFPVIQAALNNSRKERVVVICHSQGTIIMSNVLRALCEPRFRTALYQANPPAARRSRMHATRRLRRLEALSKLEIYAFANCADVMRYHRRLGDAPWIESYGNEYDLVARLGMLAPNRTGRDIHIDGAHFCGTGRWGHLLNEHYLFDMERHLTNPGGIPNPYVSCAANAPNQPPVPRLYAYYDGGRPDPYRAGSVRSQRSLPARERIGTKPGANGSAKTRMRY